MRTRTTVRSKHPNVASPGSMHRTAYPNVEHLHRIFAKEELRTLTPRYENWLGTHKTIIK